MKKLYRVEITKTLSTDIVVYAENKEEAVELAEDSDFDFSLADGDISSYANEVEILDDWEKEDIPPGEEDNRTCEEIFNYVEENKPWCPPKCQLSLQF